MNREHRQQALVWIGFWFGAVGVYPLFCPWNTGPEKGCGIVLCALVTAILARLAGLTGARVDWLLRSLVTLFVLSCAGTVWVVVAL